LSSSHAAERRLENTRRISKLQGRYRMEHTRYCCVDTGQRLSPHDNLINIGDSTIVPFVFPSPFCYNIPSSLSSLAVALRREWEERRHTKLPCRLRSSACITNNAQHGVHKSSTLRFITREATELPRSSGCQQKLNDLFVLNA